MTTAELPVTIAELSRFHAENKLLLLAHSEAGMRRLGRLVANAERLPAETVARLYRRGFDDAMSRPARRGGVVNALLHGFGVVTETLSAESRALFLGLVEAYAARSITSEEPRALLRQWAADAGEEWLAAQTLLDVEVEVA